MHPVVEQVLTTDTWMPTILSGLPDSETRSPLIQAMIRLAKLPYNPAQADEAFGMAEAVYLEPVEDVDLSLLFLRLWALASMFTGRLDQASTILQEAKLRMTGRTPLEIQSAVAVDEARLAAFRGNMDRYEDCLRQFLQREIKLIDQQHYLWYLASVLARQGRFSEIEAAVLARLKEKPGSMKTLMLALLRFIDHMENGRLQEAERTGAMELLAEVPERVEHLYFLEKYYRRRKILLDLIKEHDVHARMGQSHDSFSGQTSFHSLA